MILDNPSNPPVIDTLPVTRDAVKAMLRAYYDDDSIRVKIMSRDGGFQRWFLLRLEIAIAQVTLTWQESVVLESYYKLKEPLGEVAACLGVDERTARRHLADLVDKYTTWMNRDAESAPVT